MICPKCRQPIQANARFCGNCGQMIDSSAANQSTVPRPPMSGPAAAGAASGTSGTSPGGTSPGGASTAGGASSPRGASSAGATTGGGSTAWAATASAALPGLFERIKNIVLMPKLEWPIIAAEPTSVAQLYTGYIIPLAAVVALLGFLRLSVIGVSGVFGSAFRMPIVSGLIYAVFTFGYSLVIIFLIGLIIDALAPSFSGQRDRRQALKVAAYCLTPACLGSLLALSPVLPTLLQLIAVLYGIYVLYLGLPVVMRSPPEKAVGYTATVIVCTLVLGIVLGALAAATGIFGRTSGLMGMGYANPRSQDVAREQGAAEAANILGSALGTDDKGKAGLAAALSNLAKAGEESERQSAAAAKAAADNPAALAQSNAAGQVNAATGQVNAATGNSSDGAQNPAAAVSGLVTALGGALGGNRRVDVVDFKTLTALLPPSLPGMRRTNAQGEKQAAVGVTTSSAKADYAGDNGTSVHIEITDLSGVSGLMNIADSLAKSTTSESESGFERDTVIGGRSVHEKYDSRAKNGELSVTLAKRFMVDLTGSGIDMPSLEQSLGTIDLSQLEAMKDQGAH